MPSEKHHRQIDHGDRHEAGRDGSPSHSARRGADAEWEADPHSQIVALLAGSDDDVEEYEDAEAADVQAPADPHPEQNRSETTGQEHAPQKQGAWYSKARRRVASLFGDNEDAEQTADTAMLDDESAAGQTASEEEQSSQSGARADFKFDWVVDRVAEEQADEAEGTDAEPAPDHHEPESIDAAADENAIDSVEPVSAEAEATDEFVAEEAVTTHDDEEPETSSSSAEQRSDAAAQASAAADAVDGAAEAVEDEAKTGLSRRELQELAGLLNDEVVLEALEAGTVPLQQVVKAVRRHRDDPSVALWRHLVDVPGIDRDDLFARAARLAGYETVDITADRPSSTFLHTVLGVYPPRARQSLIEMHLLPFAFEPDVEAGQQGFLIATYDPSHADIQALLPDLEPVIRLHYAPEAIVTQRVEEMRELEKTFEWDEAEPEGETPQERAVLDVQDDEPVDETPQLESAVEDDEREEVLDVAPEREVEAGTPADELEPADDAPDVDDESDEVGVPVDEWRDPADYGLGQAARSSDERADPTSWVDATSQAAAEHSAEPAEAVAEHDADDEGASFENETMAAGEASSDVAPAALDAAPEEDVAVAEQETDVDDTALADADAETESERAGHDDLPGAGDFWEESGRDLSPRLDTDGDLTPEERADLVEDGSLVDEMEVIAASEPDDLKLISGDGYGDLNLAQAQQGEEATEDIIDLPDEPPLPPDLSWGGEPATPPSTEQAALETKDRVVAMLLHKEIVTPQQVQQASDRKEAQDLKETLWRVLAGEDGVPREAIFREAASMYAFPLLPEGIEGPDPDFARNVMNTFGESERDQLIELRVLPYELDVEEQSGAVRLAFITHDPTRPEVHKLMKKLHLERFELMYASEEIVSRALAEAFPRKNEFLERMNEGEDTLDLGTMYQEEENLIDDEALEAEINRSTLINLFEASLIEAVRRGASDLHIYPNANKQVEIHFRVDGRLAHWHTEEKVHPEAMLAVIKDNSTNVDRFERDAAQDGFIQRWIDDALIRFRVSVLPIANASQELRSESIVIRVLDDRKVITDLSKLGLLEGALERFDQAIRQPHGMVILTGPTGSGKSTTLVAALHQVVTPEVNVLTVEDPVEYIIPGVRQIKLNQKLDLSLALRAILRHDPDVVMVGEMRDRKTAELAIKLANTGHLTFSTLHTNDAPSAISRLYKMGIEPFLIAYAINLVVAQRLIRTLCSECKVPDTDPDPIMLEQLGFSEEEIAETTFYQPGQDSKCPKCRGQGYKGRRAISEALYFSRPIRHMIVEADGMIDESSIRDQAEKEGMLSLSASAREVVKMGETSAREMMRVVATGD